jgi:DNA helicase HerA-like ATPase
MLFLYRFLTDEELRSRAAPEIRDPVVRQFWLKEFPGYSKALQGEALSPVLNKLGAFVAHPVVRNIVGQERSRVDLVELMQGQSIILANLATGRIGEDASRLLGGLLLTAIQLAAMERERGGPPFFVYIDEFQNFTTDSLATMLAEARKFGLGLTLAHQYLAQLPETIRDAILGNVGSTILFRLGGSDALLLEPEFAPPFTAYDLQSLESYHVVVKLLARGENLAPFSARTLPAPQRPPGSHQQLLKIREQSRQRYCQRRPDVEAAISAALTPPG